MSCDLLNSPVGRIINKARSAAPVHQDAGDLHAASILRDLLASKFQIEYDLDICRNMVKQGFEISMFNSGLREVTPEHLTELGFKLFHAMRICDELKSAYARQHPREDGCSDVELLECDDAPPSRKSKKHAKSKKRQAADSGTGTSIRVSDEAMAFLKALAEEWIASKKKLSYYKGLMTEQVVEGKITMISMYDEMVPRLRASHEEWQDMDGCKLDLKVTSYYNQQRTARGLTGRGSPKRHTAPEGKPKLPALLIPFASPGAKQKALEVDDDSTAGTSSDSEEDLDGKVKGRSGYMEPELGDRPASPPPPPQVGSSQDKVIAELQAELAQMKRERQLQKMADEEKAKEEWEGQRLTEQEARKSAKRQKKEEAEKAEMEKEALKKKKKKMKTAAGAGAGAALAKRGVAVAGDSAMEAVMGVATRSSKNQR